MGVGHRYLVVDDSLPRHAFKLKLELGEGGAGRINIPIDIVFFELP